MEKDKPSCVPVQTASREFIQVYKNPILCLAAAGLFALPTALSYGLCMTAILAYTTKAEWRPDYPLKDTWKVPQVQKLLFLLIILCITKAILGLTDQRFYHMSRTIGITKAITLLVTLVPISFIGLSLLHGVRQARVLLRSGARTTNSWQSWTDATHTGIITAFLASITTICFFPAGPGQWICNWLLASASDAGLGIDKTIITPTLFQTINRPILQAFPEFELAVKAVMCVVTVTLLWPQVYRSASFLTSFCKRQATVPMASCISTFAQTLRRSTTRLKLRNKKPLLKNIAQSFWWLLACYAILFWLIGFSGGPLGDAIKAWLDFSILDANLGVTNGASTNNHLRIFCASIIALYGTVPLAVTGCTFLPYIKRRQLELTDDGICLPDGPYFQLGFRQTRLWSDFSSVSLATFKNKIDSPKTKIVIKFQSGGLLSLNLSQLEAMSLDKLLGAIDEHAGNCTISDDVVALRASTRAKLATYRTDSQPEVNKESSFQSTIFVPHDQGAWLPDGETRVVRLLASRPLSCVYLVRLSTGKLAVAKQLFVADDTEQNVELQKSFKREYEALQTIDHERVAKVLNMFERDGSTYLIIDHTPGSDLHRLVSDDGPQSESLVLKWALEICDILIALHSNDPPIVHRDLTPDNIVLSEDGHLHVIDFGAAHQFMEGITGTIIGKQCYVPLEQLQGQAGPRSDIYSFGCTLHYLLTGNEPVALSQCEPSKTANICPALNSLIMECTMLEQSQRPANFQDVRDRIIGITKEKQDEPERILRSFSQSIAITNFQEALKTENLVSDEAPPTVISLKHKEENYEECR